MFVDDVQSRVALDYASGTADRNGDVIDTANFEHVKFVAHIHTVAAGATTSVKVQQGDESNLSDASDLEGTSIDVAADDDGQAFVIAINKPRKRYLRLVVDKDGANAVSESAMAELYGARTRPALQSVTDETTVEIHTSPAEGTA